jgi:hypothetical protein
MTHPVMCLIEDRAGWSGVEPQAQETGHGTAYTIHLNKQARLLTTAPGVRAAIRASGALLPFLPAHKSELNPIEQAFAKIEPLLRKADARSIEYFDAVSARCSMTGQTNVPTTSARQVISQRQANRL